MRFEQWSQIKHTSEVIADTPMERDRRSPIKSHLIVESQHEPEFSICSHCSRADVDSRGTTLAGADLSHRTVRTDCRRFRAYHRARFLGGRRVGTTIQP